MNRKIVVMIPRLETALEDRIREKAGALGFSAEFYADETDARAAVADAEILVSNVVSLCAHAQSSGGCAPPMPVWRGICSRVFSLLKT